MSEYMIGQPIDWRVGSQFLDRWCSNGTDEPDDIDCALTFIDHTEYKRSE